MKMFSREFRYFFSGCIQMLNMLKKKFGVKETLVLQYRTSTGSIKTIANQKELNDAMAAGLKILYVNKKGEHNEYLSIQEEHKSKLLKQVELRSYENVKKALDKAPVLVNIADDTGRTPLHIAALNGDMEGEKILFSIYHNQMQ
jgi:ankyrin repeat protein